MALQETRAILVSDFATDATNELGRIASTLIDDCSTRISLAAMKALFDMAVAEERSNFTCLANSAFIIATDTTDVITEGANPDKWFFSAAHLLTRFQNQDVTTDNLVEGVGNLYFTEARADARAVVKINELRPTQSFNTTPIAGATISFMGADGITPSSFVLQDASLRAVVTSLIATLKASNILV